MSRLMLRALARGLATATLAWLAGCQGTAAAGGGAGLLWPGATSHRDPPAEGRDSTDEFGALERKLAAYRRDRAQTAVLAAHHVAQCEEMYALTQSICEVKEKLCELAQAHRDMPSYRSLCQEAQHECIDAQASCEACLESAEPRDPLGPPT